MIKTLADSETPKSKGQRFFEYVLFVLCLCVIALRATYTESPVAKSSTLPIRLGDPIYSLVVSGVLLFAFICWFTWRFCTPALVYRPTGIEIGLFVFTIAAIPAIAAAANKRLAIIDFVMLWAPVLMAVLLVQLLDCRSKIILLLCVIAALGVVAAYQSAEQFFFSNQMTIEQYRQDPVGLLKPLDIRPDSFQQFLFEHRLYSKGVRGFFTTSNSAGSFSLMACFSAVALFITALAGHKRSPSEPARLVACAIGVAAVLFGLVITRSKGALAASLVAAAMFIAYLTAGVWIRKHKKAIVALCLLLAVAGGIAVVRYGRTHAKLPGGSSMLVRWQYWQASAKMYADHPCTGVGPGNFAGFYTRYKPDEALESVADPHNFPLSILCQYGPAGLLGFLAMILIPAWTVISSKRPATPRRSPQQQPRFTRLSIPALFIISAALLLIRPIVMPVANDCSAEVLAYLIVSLYIAPVAVFAAGIVLLSAPLWQKQQTKQTPHDVSVTVAALFCAAVAVLLHNLIDFAIFEPGVYTAFWALVACLIASDSQAKAGPSCVIRPPIPTKILAVAAGFAVAAAYLNYVFVPVVTSTSGIQRAHRAASAHNFERAHRLLDAAAEADRLSPAALNLNGRLYLQHFKDTGGRNSSLLQKAADCFTTATARDKAAFRNYENLSHVHRLLGDDSSAYRWCLRAAKLYPGSARLHFKLAEIAESLDRREVAVVEYTRAVEIEDKYRRQFQVMYPGRPIVSRLGREKYDWATQRLDALRLQSAP